MTFVYLAREQKKMGKKKKKLHLYYNIYLELKVRGESAKRLEKGREGGMIKIFCFLSLLFYFFTPTLYTEWLAALTNLSISYANHILLFILAKRALRAAAFDHLGRPMQHFCIKCRTIAVQRHGLNFLFGLLYIFTHLSILAFTVHLSSSNVAPSATWKMNRCPETFSLWFIFVLLDIHT